MAVPKRRKLHPGNPAVCPEAPCPGEDTALAPHAGAREEDPGPGSVGLPLSEYLQLLRPATPAELIDHLQRYVADHLRAARRLHASTGKRA